MTKKEIKILQDTLREVYDFLDRFVEMYINDTPVEPGERTDAQILSDKLPIIKGFIDAKNPLTINKPPAIKLEDNKVENPNVQEFLECMFGCDDKTKADIKNHLYYIAKFARESVNPNYKFCVANCNLSECYLTDDIGMAMEFASKKSKGGDSWRVLSIRKCKDGYRTFIEGYCYDGHYYEEGGSRDFLHFDYIAQVAEIMGKI